MSLADDCAALRRLLVDVVPSGDFEALSDYVHADVVLPQDLPGESSGIARYREGLAHSHASLEFTHELADMIAEGDRIVARLIVRGRQIAPFMGRPNHGRRFTMDQIVIAQFRDGKVARFWRAADVHGLLRQLAGE